MPFAPAPSTGTGRRAGAAKLRTLDLPAWHFADDVVEGAFGNAVEVAAEKGLARAHCLRYLPALDGARVVDLVSIGDLVNWIISGQCTAISQMESYIMGGYSG